jgi:hypothetical protein
MPFYYLTDVKVPTREAPAGRQEWARAWRPLGWDSQTADHQSKWILLSKTTDHAIIRLENSVSNADLHLLAEDKAERIGSATIARLESLVGNDRTIAAGSFGDVIGAILRDPPADGRLGSALRPNRRRGVYEVRFGSDVIYTASGPIRERATVTLTDNFNRTAADLDGSTASGGGTWDELDGTSLSTDGTTVGLGANVFFNTAWITTDHDTDDQFAQMDLTNLTAGSGTGAAGVGVRIEGASGNDGYACEVTSTGAVRLYRWDTDADLDTGLVTLGLPDTIYLEFDGSAYEVQFNGALITGMSGTNTLFTGHLRTVITFYTAASGSAARGDNFQSSDIAAVGRTVLNTRSNPLGLAVGMGWRMPW